MPTLNRARNLSMTKAGEQSAITFELAEFVHMRCDVHPWMSAWVGVFDNPFHAVTQEEGSFSISGIPAGTYKGQDSAVEVATVQNYLVTRSDLKDDVVYEMTKTLFDNLPALQAAHAAAKAVKLDEAAKSPPVPLHPGAAKFYKEKGIGS